MKIKEIIKDNNPLLRQKSVPVIFPLIEEDKKLLEYMLEFLELTKDPVKCDELGLKSGVGIAAPQLGVLKQMIAINYIDLEGNEHIYGLINPKIISRSATRAIINGGEGCLSVDEDRPGIVPRYNQIKVKFIDFFTMESKEIKVNGYLAIIFQHEIDHLNGILYYDRIIADISLLGTDNIKYY